MIDSDVILIVCVVVQLAVMSADELRAAYAARANEVRILTSKLKHKATSARVMFRQNVNSKLEGLNKPVRLPAIIG